jgi:hypothetical protein
MDEYFLTSDCSFDDAMNVGNLFDGRTDDVLLDEDVASPTILLLLRIYFMC